MGEPAFYQVEMLKIELELLWIFLDFPPFFYVFIVLFMFKGGEIVVV